MNVSWDSTREALESFKNTLRCGKCCCIASVPTRYAICGHLFCKACSAVDSSCNACAVSVQPNEKRHDTTLESLIRYCSVIHGIIQEDEHTGVQNDDTNFKKSPSPPYAGPIIVPRKLANKNDNRRKYTTKNINKRNRKGETALHTACVNGKEEDARYLLSIGANPNTKDNAQWTPLQEAVSLGFYSVSKMLLEYGASPDTPGYDNKTALHEAAKDDRLEEARLLLRYRANKHVFDVYGKKPVLVDYSSSAAMSSILQGNYADEEDAKCSLGIDVTLNRSVALLNSQFVILPLNLETQWFQVLRKVSSVHKIKIVKNFRSSVTHVIAQVNDRNVAKLSYDVMLAIVNGKWILNPQWISACLELEHIPDMDLELFEVTFARSSCSPRRARINGERLNPRLFDKCFFHFALQPNVRYYAGDMELTKEGLANLVTEGGGQILTREPNPEEIKDMDRAIPFHVADKPLHPLHRCTHYIIYAVHKDEPRVKYNMPHIKTLPLAWLIECIERFALIDPSFLGVV